MTRNITVTLCNDPADMGIGGTVEDVTSYLALVTERLALAYPAAAVTIETTSQQGTRVLDSGDTASEVQDTIQAAWEAWCSGERAGGEKGTVRRMSTPEEERRFREALLEEGLKPCAASIARIHLNGDVAVLFFDIVAGDDELALSSQRAARAMGWTGKRVELGAMNKTGAARFADALAAYAPTDPAVAWLRSRKSGRIFVFAHAGTLCMNYEPGAGYSVEPGTVGFVPGEGKAMS